VTAVPRLPTEFADLERFAGKWCKPTEDARWDERLASTFEEVEEFYNTIAPRAEEAIAFCDRHPLDAMPDEVKNLVYLLCSLTEVSFPVECWKQVRVPDTGAARVDCIVQPIL
jgi:hypothetical protein